MIHGGRVLPGDTGLPGQTGPQLASKNGNGDLELRAVFLRMTYCFARSSSMVIATSSPIMDAGALAAMPKSVRLMVVVAEKPA